MALSEQEKTRIRDEELARLQVREDSKREKTSKLIVWAVLWTNSSCCTGVRNPAFAFLTDRFGKAWPIHGA